MNSCYVDHFSRKLEIFTQIIYLPKEKITNFHSPAQSAPSPETVGASVLASVFSGGLGGLEGKRAPTKTPAKTKTPPAIKLNVICSPASVAATTTVISGIMTNP